MDFLSSLTDLFVLMAVVERMLLVDSQRRERDVLLELAGESQSSWMRWSSGSTAIWYLSIPSSDQIALVRTLSTLRATMLSAEALVTGVAGIWNEETIMS